MKETLIKRIKKYDYAYYFILQTIIGMFLVHFVPMVQGIYMAFLKLNQNTLSMYLGAPFVGLENFIDILFNPNSLIRISGLGGAFRNTIIYAFVVTFMTIAFGLMVAIMMNRKFKGRALIRTLFLLPWVVPQFVTGLLWGFMWQADNGIINFILVDLFHILKIKPFWLIGPNTLWAIIIPTVWRAWPFSMLMLLAGLQNISDDYYDAAKIDWASALQQFRYITMPLLKPVWAVLILF